MTSDADGKPEAGATAGTDTASAYRTEPGYGRRVLLAVGVAVVCTTGLIGYVAGTNNTGRVAAVELFGLVSVPTTGLAWATVGVALAAVGLAVLFGLVELASRFDEAGGR